MRVAIVGPTHPYTGGAAQHATELARRMSDAGHTVDLESWSAQYPARMYPGSMATGDPDFALHDRTRRTLSWRRPDSWWRLGRRLRTRADLVVFFLHTPVQVPPYLVMLATLRGSNVRTVALCNNVLPHEERALDVRLMRALLRRVDAVFVHSEDQAGVARRLTQAPVSVAALAPHLPATRTVRPAGDVSVYNRLLFFGVVRHYKGVDVLLRALAEGPDEVSLTVAGEFWDPLTDYENLTAQLGLSGRVTLRPGFVPGDELDRLFAESDALVMPYRSATSSQNAWVAFEHGLPVISTRAGSLDRLVRDDVDGLLCEPDDVASLADAIRRFYTDGTAARLRSNVRPVDPAPYWARYIDTLLSAVDRSATGHGRDQQQVGGG